VCQCDDVARIEKEKCFVRLQFEEHFSRVDGKQDAAEENVQAFALVGHPQQLCLGLSVRAPLIVQPNCNEQAAIEHTFNEVLCPGHERNTILSSITLDEGPPSQNSDDPRDQPHHMRKEAKDQKMVIFPLKPSVIVLATVMIVVVRPHCRSDGAPGKNKWLFFLKSVKWGISSPSRVLNEYMMHGVLPSAGLHTLPRATLPRAGDLRSAGTFPIVILATCVWFVVRL
jgi:hypothetical protein